MLGNRDLLSFMRFKADLNWDSGPFRTEEGLGRRKPLFALAYNCVSHEPRCVSKLGKEPGRRRGRPPALAFSLPPTAREARQP